MHRIDGRLHRVRVCWRPASHIVLTDVASSHPQGTLEGASFTSSKTENVSSKAHKEQSSGGVLTYLIPLALVGVAIAYKFMMQQQQH